MAQKLQGWCAGQRIDVVQVLRNPGDRYDLTEATGKIIKDIWRRGKYLEFDLGPDGAVICHNAMSGFWDMEDEPWTFDYVEGVRKATSGDVRVVLSLSNGRKLRFHDVRLFGNISHYPPGWAAMPYTKLGPDAIKTKRLKLDAPTFNVLDSAVFLSNKKPIKQLLLEQNRIAGVGNIYAVEALWRSQIHPARPGVSLKGADHQRLTETIQSVLNQAISMDLRYDEYLQVYRRIQCCVCGKKIEKMDIAKRTTYFCVHCQH